MGWSARTNRSRGRRWARGTAAGAVRELEWGNGATGAGGADVRDGGAGAERGLRRARSGLTVLAVSATLMVGAGLGAVAALAATPAGASTAHSSLPPVNVSVTNTPTVNVGNLPTNSAGRLRVQNGIGSTVAVVDGPWGQLTTSSQAPVTIANFAGPGIFKGATWWSTNANCSAFDGLVYIYIDGQMVMGGAWSSFAWPSGNGTWGTPGQGSNFFGGASESALGGSIGTWCQSPTGHFFPPGGLPFRTSLVMTMQPAPWWNQPNTQVWVGGMVWASVGN